MMQSYFDPNTELDDIFMQSLVDCLPGTFYIYQILPDAVRMRRCNRVHQEFFGLTEEECFDRTPFSYVDPDYHETLEEALKQIENLGSAKQVLLNIIDKHKNSVPFVFEGYKFMLGDALYFLGVGINVSDLVSAKEQISILQNEKEIIAREVQKKERELLTLALQENLQKAVFDITSLKIDALMKHQDIDTIKSALIKLKNEIKSKTKIGDNWSRFKELFINIHKDFFEILKLKHPDLTQGEIRFCAYIKINMSSVNLCNVLNISKDGLKKKRYRLRKKLELSSRNSIKEYINSI